MELKCDVCNQLLTENDILTDRFGVNCGVCAPCVSAFRNVLLLRRAGQRVTFDPAARDTEA